MNTFTESQRFRQWWLWAIMGYAALSVIYSPSTAGKWTNPTQWLGGVIVVAVTGLLYMWRLDTRLDSAGVHYRVFPVFSWRTISWDNIRSASVCQRGFVGYGIRWDFNGWVYNIAGNKGLELQLTNGRQITIGTQRPEEVQRFLEQQPVIV